MGFGAHARPRAVLRPHDQSRPHRIERDIARRRDQVLFIEGATDENRP
jgi:hypothetical protein